MMNFCGTFPTVNAAPIISPEYYITLTLPGIGLKILVVMLSTAFAARFKYVIL
ncbi:MAG: hypothetical protein JSU01_13820 [Bacteroidetes bacterium]|nr:hypothetical protein [Bacteroidota bacterium]